MADPDRSGADTCARAARRPPRFAEWSATFLAELAATSNVSAAARKAGIGTSTAYEARRLRPDFNRKWMQALYEGYDHLEMELLCRLRMGEVKPAAGARKGVRTFDNATAFRLLAVHRETAARQRAIAENEDTEAILASIDAKLERMRQRRLDGRQKPVAQPVPQPLPPQDDDDARTAHPAPEPPVEPEAGHIAGPVGNGTAGGTAPAD